MLYIRQCNTEDIVERSRHGFMIVKERESMRAKFFSKDGRFELKKYHNETMFILGGLTKFFGNFEIEFMEEI